LLKHHETNELGDIFAALADPTRRGMVGRLTQGPCSVSELAAASPLSAPAISKHLNVLEASGLIVRWKQGRTYYCRLRGDPLRLAGEWIEQQRSFWEQQCANLDDFLHREDGTWTTPRSEPTPSSGIVTGSKRPSKGSLTPGCSRAR
jgi:DNA-binding transcriptional ArsR family regulator